MCWNPDLRLLRTRSPSAADLFGRARDAKCNSVASSCVASSCVASAGAYPIPSTKIGMIWSIDRPPRPWSARVYTKRHRDAPLCRRRRGDLTCPLCEVLRQRGYSAPRSGPFLVANAVQKLRDLGVVLLTHQSRCNQINGVSMLNYAIA